MTDPYQQNPGGPQYGPPGTGPDLNKPGAAPGQPQYNQPPSDPYAQQAQYGQPPQPQYGQQPGGYPPAQYGGQPGGYPPDAEAPYGRDMYGTPYSDKEKLTAGLLQLFLGSFGVGRFYTGHTTIAILQLVTCGGCGIWSLIDGIMMITGKVPDAEGRPLRG